jgi:hypothetical protein
MHVPQHSWALGSAAPCRKHRTLAGQGVMSCEHNHGPCAQARTTHSLPPVGNFLSAGPRAAHQPACRRAPRCAGQRARAQQGGPPPGARRRSPGGARGGRPRRPRAPASTAGCGPPAGPAGMRAPSARSAAVPLACKRRLPAVPGTFRTTRTVPSDERLARSAHRLRRGECTFTPMTCMHEVCSGDAGRAPASGARRGGRDLEALCVVDAQQAHLPARQQQADARVGGLERRHAVDGRRAPAHGICPWRRLSTLSTSVQQADATFTIASATGACEVGSSYWPARTYALAEFLADTHVSVQHARAEVLCHGCRHALTARQCAVALRVAHVQGEGAAAGAGRVRAGVVALDARPAGEQQAAGALAVLAALTHASGAV